MSTVIEQNALTLVAPIRDGDKDNLDALLRDLAAGGVDDLELDLRQVESLHFGRFVILPWRDIDGEKAEAVPPKLAFESNYDGPLDEHLEELYETNGPAFDRILSHCEGYDGAGQVDRFNAYVRKHTVPTVTYYRAHSGLGVAQIRNDEAVREAIEAWLDAEQRAGRLENLSAGDIRGSLLAHLAGIELHGKPLVLGQVERGLPKKPWCYLRFVLVVLRRLVHLVWLASRVRFHEMQEEEDAAQHPRHLVSDMDPRLDGIHRSEDQLEQNGLTHLVPIKPGPYRHSTLLAALWVVGMWATYIEFDGSLGGLSTIHFARWAVLDDGRLLFFSNYDGSWEAYLGDFIDKVSPWLTVVWTNTKWFPSTRWLICDGAAEERTFKRWTRTCQLENQLWYSAYPRLTVDAVLENARIREQAAENLEGAALTRWLRRL